MTTLSTSLKAMAIVAALLVPAAAQAGILKLNRGSTVMLNPQPLPPAPCKTCGLSAFKYGKFVMPNYKYMMLRRR